VAARAKRFEYAIAVDRAGRISARGEPVELDDSWSPDHLLLAALALCTIQSLCYHARRAAIDVSAEASALGVVTKRDEDGRYALVDVECALDVELDPEPEGADLSELIGEAERDCFVGASLTVEPRYRWRIGGRDVANVLS
jgi:organic hydroperoxide reductase OsmC/OhrA